MLHKSLLTKWTRPLAAAARNLLAALATMTNRFTLTTTALLSRVHTRAPRAPAAAAAAASATVAARANAASTHLAHGIDCTCYFSQNIFVEGRHYTYIDAAQFEADHGADHHQRHNNRRFPVLLRPARLCR